MPPKINLDNFFISMLYSYEEYFQFWLQRVVNNARNNTPPCYLMGLDETIQIGPKLTFGSFVLPIGLDCSS